VLIFAVRRAMGNWLNFIPAVLENTILELNLVCAGLTSFDLISAHDGYFSLFISSLSCLRHKFGTRVEKELDSLCLLLRDVNDLWRRIIFWFLRKTVKHPHYLELL
jgi:hypothetical protein